MCHTIPAFLAAWSYECGAPQKHLDTISDASLGTSAVPEGRMIGRLAWHII